MFLAENVRLIGLERTDLFRLLLSLLVHYTHTNEVLK